MQQINTNQSLTKKLPVYLFTLLLAAPLVVSTVFAAEPSMHLDKTFSSQTLQEAEAHLRKN